MELWELRVTFIKIMGLHRATNMLPLQVGTHISTVPTQKQGVVCRGFTQ
jgi:hypothetical protein